MPIHNTDMLPLRVRMYWQGAHADHATIVGDMYATKVLTYTVLHAWIEGLFIKLDAHGLVLGDLTRIVCGTINELRGGYGDETGKASYIIERTDNAQNSF